MVGYLFMLSLCIICMYISISLSNKRTKSIIEQMKKDEEDAIKEIKEFSKEVEHE